MAQGKRDSNVKMTKEELENALDGLRHTMESERKQHEKKLAKLTAERDDYKKFWRDACEREEKGGKTYRERIETHRSTLETMIKSHAELYELIVDARFEESPDRIRQLLGQCREKIKSVVTKEVIDLSKPSIFPPYANWTLLLGGLFALPLLMHAVYTTLGAAPRTPAETPTTETPTAETPAEAPITAAEVAAVKAT